MGYEELSLPPLKELKEEKQPICKKCNDKGFVKEANGSVHVCFDCLSAGRLDVHSTNIKGSGVKI